MMAQRQTERQKREEAAYQFELQADKLYLAVSKRLSNYRYVIQDEAKGQELTAMVLCSSWDFYEYRLNRGKQRIDLLVVQRHNAVVPLPVLSLQTSREYTPGTVPDIGRAHAKKPNHEESMLLVSKLLLGLDGVEAELAKLSPRSQQRYKQRCKAYLRPRVGRPWAS
jgi:hypothetical protein